MSRLEEFYYNIGIRRDDRFNTIIEKDNVLIVNFDTIFERACGLRGVDQLVYQLHKQGFGKRFLFLTEDGAILQLSGAVEIIKNVIKTFNLDESTCAVVCRENLVIPGATIINNEAIPSWCRVLYPTIVDIKIPQGSFGKKFAVWVNRGTFYRLDIVRYLHSHHKDDSYISYQESGMLVDRKLTEYFREETIWASNNTPIVYDQIFSNREYTHDMIVGSTRKPYDDYFMEIVLETDILSTNWITEKTVKNLYIGKPFIVLGGVGALAKIRSFGFKTFSPWIDESYDQVENIYQRIEMIKKEIDRLAVTITASTMQEMLPVLEYNREVYGNYINSR